MQVGSASGRGEAKLEKSAYGQRSTWDELAIFRWGCTHTMTNSTSKAKREVENFIVRCSWKLIINQGRCKPNYFSGFRVWMGASDVGGLGWWWRWSWGKKEVEGEEMWPFSCAYQRKEWKEKLEAFRKYFSKAIPFRWRLNIMFPSIHLLISTPWPAPFHRNQSRPELTPIQ